MTMLLSFSDGNDARIELFPVFKAKDRNHPIWFMTLSPVWRTVPAGKGELINLSCGNGLRKKSN